MSSAQQVTAAAVQATPVFLDREATTAKACDLIDEAAGKGAGLICFPEAFIPTYPEWAWRRPPWSDSDLFPLLLENSVSVPGKATESLGRAAARAEAYVTIGINERADKGSTIYNTLLFFGPDGALLGKHRKLMPTGAERLVWGTGDGSTLRVYETPFGRLGGLICWENYMPLARSSLYAQGIDIYVAPTWDTSDVWVPTLRHIAKEGRIYVIGICCVLRESDVPSSVPGRDELYPSDDWMARGLSTIVGPDGEVVAGPLIEEEGILVAKLNANRARASRQQFDPVGHYARPDVFHLQVDARPKPAVTFSYGPMAATEVDLDVPEDGRSGQADPRYGDDGAVQQQVQLIRGEEL